MSTRWCYIVEATDRVGVVQRETFLFPADARHRFEERRRAGFYRVALRQRRVQAQGQTTPMRPGFYGEKKCFPLYTLQGSSQSPSYFLPVKPASCGQSVIVS